MSIWFNLKGKTYTGTQPVSWLKQYVEYLTDKLHKDVTQEVTLRQNETAALSSALDAEVQARQEADDAIRASLDTTLSDRLDAEVQARQEADEAIRASLDTTLSDRLDTETQARQEADATMQSVLDARNLKNGTGENSVQGIIATAEGKNSFAFGNQASATYENAIAIGSAATASELGAIALGSQNTASGSFSIAAGIGNTASSSMAIALGKANTASAVAATAIGANTKALGVSSLAVGDNTVASGNYQFVSGKFNVEDPDGEYAMIVGSGTRKTPFNIYTLDWSGNAEFAGMVYASGAPLVTRTEMTTRIGDIEAALDEILAIQNTLMGGDAA